MVILAILASGAVPARAQEISKKEEEYKKMTTLIESGRYIFRVQSISPTGARTIHTTSAYTMTSGEGGFKASLPYFGRSYQANYGGDGGIEFDGEPENLEITRIDKKRTIRVSFMISGSNDKYSVNLSAGSNGYGTLSITCNNRQPISYYGTINPLDSP